MPANQDVNINLVANNAQAKAKIAETEAQVKQLGNTAEESLNVGKGNGSIVQGIGRFRSALMRLFIPATIAGGIARIVKGFEDARAAVVDFQTAGINAALNLTASFSKIGRASTGGIADQIRDLGEAQAEALQKIEQEKQDALRKLQTMPPALRAAGQAMGTVLTEGDIEAAARVQVEAVNRGVAQAKKNLAQLEKEQNVQLQQEIDTARGAEKTKAEQIEIERVNRHQSRLLEIEKASQHKSNAFRKRMLEDLDNVEQENFKKRVDRELGNQRARLQQEIQELRNDLFARHGIDSVDQGALGGEQMLEFMNLVIPSIIRRSGGR